MIDLAAFGGALERGANGCWFSAHAPTLVSYPAENNDVYFAFEDESFWFRHRNDCIVQLVCNYPPAGPVFDVGGGNGVVAAALERAGVPTVLVEPGLPGACNARLRGCPTVICATLEQAGFPATSLPAVGLFDVLEHIEAAGSFLDQVYSRLAPGGRLYLTVPAIPVLWSFDDEDAGHFRRYTLATLGRALRTAGFTVDFASYLFWFLPLPLFLWRSVPSWFRLRALSDRKQVRQEHVRPGGWKGALLDRLLRVERERLGRRQPMPFGSSCLAAAHRPE